MKTWTIDEMMNEKPCSRYTREILVDLWAGRESVSIETILKEFDISSADKMWAVWKMFTAMIVAGDPLGEVQQKELLDKIVTRKWISNEDRTAAGAATWAAEAATWAAEAAAKAAGAAWATETEYNLQIIDTLSVIEKADEI
jgi:hypothetical protein